MWMQMWKKRGFRENAVRRACWKVSAIVVVVSDWGAGLQLRSTVQGIIIG